MKKQELTQIKLKTESGMARFIWKTIEGSQHGFLVRSAWNKNYYSYDGGKTWAKSAKEAMKSAS